MNTLSHWLRSTIREAYSELSPSKAKLLKIRAHEIRAVASSVALERNVAITDIIRSVGWRSDSVFARHYLRDLSSWRSSLNDVGPISAAQSITLTPTQFGGLAQ